jgi:hypothetical protein
MKYIGALHSYIRHTLLLFNPANLDEVCVQATHLENRGKHVQDDPTKKFKKFNKFNKFKKKDKEIVTIKREEGEQCWKLHPEKRLKHFSGKGKTKTVATVQQDLGSDSGDEGKIIAVGVQGKDSLHASSNSNN